MIRVVQRKELNEKGMDLLTKEEKRPVAMDVLKRLLVVLLRVLFFFVFFSIFSLTERSERPFREYLFFFVS